MYFVCNICGKHADDGCPPDRICLECIDKSFANRDLMNYKMFYDLSMIASKKIDSSVGKEQSYWNGYFQAVEDVQKKYKEIRKQQGN